MAFSQMQHRKFDISQLAAEDRLIYLEDIDRFCFLAAIASPAYPR